MKTLTQLNTSKSMLEKTLKVAVPYPTPQQLATLEYVQVLQELASRKLLTAPPEDCPAIVGELRAYHNLLGILSHGD